MDKTFNTYKNQRSINTDAPWNLRSNLILEFGELFNLDSPIF